MAEFPVGAHDELRVNGARLRASIEEISEIGRTPGGGVSRLTLSDEDRRARDLFVRWLEQCGAQVTVDQVGNIFGRRPGKRDHLAPVLSGSHLDSQPSGGRFDGTLGVLAALEVLRTLAERDITTARPLVAVNWTNEEGTRFQPSMAGSGVWSGRFDPDWLCERADLAGLKLGDELQRIGYRGPAPARFSPVHAYYEYHIEQGPVLEQTDTVIGVPEGIVAIHWYDVYVEGVSNQVGPTPMEGRSDALCAAAEMILRVNAVPGLVGGGLVATVGEIHNSPNSRNIIPGHVRFTVDIRCWETELADRAWQILAADFAELAGARGCTLRTEPVTRVDRAVFDDRLVRRVADAAERLGLSHRKMLSGAGHDASYMNPVAPTAMIFVPSVGGRSHVEVELTLWEHCEAGANVLLQCMLQSAMEE